MYIVCVSGMSGVGKTTFSRNVKQYFDDKDKSINLIEVDKISRETFDMHPELITETINYLNSRYDAAIKDLRQFWDLLIFCRYEDDEMQDPLYKHITSVIDGTIDNTTDSIVLIDWSMLPKSKYFDLCDKRVLVKSLHGEQRTTNLEQRDADIVSIKRREKYGLDYSKYCFDDVVVNSYSGPESFLPFIEEMYNNISVNQK